MSVRLTRCRRGGVVAAEAEGSAAAVPAAETFDFYLQNGNRRYKHLVDQIEVEVHNDEPLRGCIYTFTDFIFAPHPAAGQVERFDVLDPGASRVHKFNVRLTNAKEVGVKRSVRRRRVPFRFGLAVIYEPSSEEVLQIDPSDSPSYLAGLVKSWDDLIIDPDCQPTYRGVISVPNDVTPNYVICYHLKQ
jgi:hypothetical protein